mgnify:CR=1 FL=1
MKKLLIGVAFGALLMPAAALAHLANVGTLLGQMLAVSDLVRLEIHGPAAELDQMRGPLAEFKPAWFVWECGVAR